MDGYSAIPAVRKPKERKISRCRSWPAILSTVIGCVLCVVVGVAVVIGLFAVSVVLAGATSTPQDYVPGETRFSSIPLFFCKSITLDVTINSKQPEVNFGASIYVVDSTPPISPIRRPLTISGKNDTQDHAYRLVTYLLPQSTINVSACVSKYTYSLYIFKGYANLQSFAADPASAAEYSLIPDKETRITTLCSEGNDTVFFNVSGSDIELYVVAFVSEMVPFKYNTKVVFNRTEYSLANESYPNCTTFASGLSCKVPVPLSTSSRLLVSIPVPSNWSNNSNALVKLYYESRPESFVIISVLPLIAVLLPVCLFGVFGSFCKCNRKSKKVKVVAMNENDPVAPLIRDGLRPFIPNDD